MCIRPTGGPNLKQLWLLQSTQGNVWFPPLLSPGFSCFPKSLLFLVSLALPRSGAQGKCGKQARDVPLTEASQTWGPSYPEATDDPPGIPQTQA